MKGKIGESKKRLKVSLIYDRVRWEEKQLFKAAKNRNIDIKMVDSKRESFDLSEESEVFLQKFGDVSLQRCISHFRGLHIAAILESKGVKVVNKFQTSMVCGNKLLTTLALQKAGVPTPKTAVTFHLESSLEALKEIGYPAVLKPVTGSWGRLMAVLNDEATAKTVIEMREEMKNALLNIYYIQKWVDRPPRDVRVLVVGDEVVAASYRYSPEGDWRTNVARGGKSEPCPLTSELKELVLKAAHAVGGGVLAVDCMESKDSGLLVHEINTTVEFKGLASTTNIDLAGKIIDYVIGVAKK